MRINNEIVNSKNINKSLVRILVTVMVMLLVSSLMVTININTSFAASKSKKKAKTKTSTIAAPEIEAESAVVLSASTSEVVYSSRKDRKLQPGGTVQLMVAMVVIDNMHDDKEYKNNVQISDDMYGAGTTFPSGSSIKVEDLMYTMLMSGDAESAKALAIYSAGSEANFVDQMNSKAQQLGLVNTRYTNATGEYDTDQYSTVEDTAKIAKAAYQYGAIKRMSGEASHTVKVTDGEGDKKITNSHPFMSGSDSYRGFKGGIYSKLTEPEGKEVFLAYATHNDMNLVVVLFDEAEGKSHGDATKLFNYGFKKATQKVIIKKGVKIGKVKVKHGAKTRLKVYTASKGFVYIPPEGSDSLIKTEPVIFNNVEAPLKAGDKVGEYRIYVANELTGTVDLVVKEDVKIGWPPSYIYISNMTTVIICLILFIIIVLFVRARNIKRRKKRMRARKHKEKIREIAKKRLEIEEDRRRRNWTYK